MATDLRVPNKYWISKDHIILMICESECFCCKVNERNNNNINDENLNIFIEEQEIHNKSMEINLKGNKRVELIQATI